jgi:sulfinoalanine decarboxylase
MVGYGSFQGTEFIRFVTINYGNDEADILRYFKQVEEFVEKEM